MAHVHWLHLLEQSMSKSRLPFAKNWKRCRWCGEQLAYVFLGLLLRVSSDLDVKRGWRQNQLCHTIWHLLLHQNARRSKKCRGIFLQNDLSHAGTSTLKEHARICQLYHRHECSKGESHSWSGRNLRKTLGSEPKPQPRKMHVRDPQRQSSWMSRLHQGYQNKPGQDSGTFRNAGATNNQTCLETK